MKGLLIKILQIIWLNLKDKLCFSGDETNDDGANDFILVCFPAGVLVEQEAGVISADFILKAKETG